MTRAEPPFEPAQRADRESPDSARRVANHWRHETPLRSLTEMHETLDPTPPTKR